MGKYEPVDLEEIKTYSITTRNNKVKVSEHFAAPPRAGMTCRELLEALPKLLGAESLTGVV